MKAYCLSADEIVEILHFMRSETEPENSGLATTLEDARHWDAKFIVLSLFVARLLERYRGQSERQVEVIESLHDKTPGIWLEIVEMDQDYIRQLLLQDPGVDSSLDEILTEVAERIAVYNYESTLRTGR